MAGSNLFTGTLELLILETLRAGPLHGYAVGKHLKERTEGVLDPEEGVLYPALYRLTRKDLIQGTWGATDTGRRARFYTLTALGREALEEERVRWERHIRAVQAILNPEQSGA